MIIWLVMQLNQWMFGAITNPDTLHFVQAMSFFELLAEMVVVATFIVVHAMDKWGDV